MAGETFDPSQPLYAADGYEYQDYAAYLLGVRAATERNVRIASLRMQNTPEADIEQYIAFYDEGRSPCSTPLHAAGWAQAEGFLGQRFVRGTLRVAR